MQELLRRDFGLTEDDMADEHWWTLGRLSHNEQTSLLRKLSSNADSPSAKPAKEVIARALREAHAVLHANSAMDMPAVLLDRQEPKQQPFSQGLQRKNELLAVSTRGLGNGECADALHSAEKGGKTMQRNTGDDSKPATHASGSGQATADIPEGLGMTQHVRNAAAEARLRDAKACAPKAWGSLAEGVQALLGELLMKDMLPPGTLNATSITKLASLGADVQTEVCVPLAH